MKGILVAVSPEGIIGKDNTIPWHYSADLKRFKRLTTGKTIIMGRKTWDSLPVKPLPNRENIVMSSSNVTNTISFNSYGRCIENLKKKNIEKVFIIGGRSIYKLFFNSADYLHITNIHSINNKINEFFPISINVIKNKFKNIHAKKLCSEATYTLWVKQ